MSKQTAVEWLLNELDYETICKFDKQLVQAKEMEKEQIEDSHKHGFSEGVVFGASLIGCKYMTSEEYYIETYGGNK
jgi:hypothetical protein